ncbi:MAG: dihydrofolate reductase family protein [Saprospiraceae bacterium]|nr:dihydrofolate reductase family protein [Saprospiraceae bacterium]MCB0669927.1 dihydrofolate reductase family protein [Saprospiraceae bacterium]MCB9321008.1 dihydrofolate reductase family protein [Lewinellaceae bacterium]
MAKVIAVINMTLDGYCDHTVMIADEEIHQHYSELLRNAGAIIYGRITYQLMESYWPGIVVNPTGTASMDDFADSIHNTPKVLFSRTIKQVSWNNTRLADRGLEDEINALKQQLEDPVYLGSPGIIAACTNLKLIDEYQLCIHPVLAGNGLPLFLDLNDRSLLKLKGTKIFSSGCILLYYESTKPT